MEYENIASMNKALSRINGLYQKWCQSHTVNMYLLKVLYALYMEPDLQQKELSRNYQIPSQTVNNAIQNLKKSGYIELKQDEQDKRRKKISFTDTGMEYAKEVLAPCSNWTRTSHHALAVKNSDSSPPFYMPMGMHWNKKLLLIL